MSFSDAAPTHVWQTIYGRALFSFEAALAGPEKNYYADDEVVADLSQQHAKLFFSMNLFYFVSLFISYMLLNSTESAEIAVRTPVVEIDNLILTSQILILVLSVTYVWFLQRFFSGLLLGSALFRIIETSGFTTPNYVIARKVPYNLWVELVKYHTIGYSSGFFHRVILLSLFGFMLLALISQMIFINYASIKSYLEIYNASAFSFFISTLSASSILVATIMAFVAVVVPLKFKFIPPIESEDARTS